METIYWSNVLQRIEEDRTINFIAEVITPLHVLGVEAFIMHLEETGVKCKGFILVVAHDSSGIILSEKAFHSDRYSNIEHYLLEQDGRKQDSVLGFYAGLKKDIGKGNTLYYASPFRPSVNKIPDVMRIRKNDRLRAVITEEGTASYLTTPYSFEKCKAIGWKARDYVRFFWQSMVRNRVYEFKLGRKGKLESFTLLNKQNGKYIRNDLCVRQFQKLLANKSIDNHYSVYENAVVILPSLLYEAGIISKREDLEIYKKIRNALPNEKFVVKPHPREIDVQTYLVLDCVIEKESKVSAEEIFATMNVKPKCIIGDTGTAMVNIAVLYGIKTIAINKLINRDVLCQNDYFDGYNKVFGDIMSIPNTWDELETILKEL